MRDDLVSTISDTFDVTLIVRFGNISENAEDVDLLIVSNDFEGISRLKRTELIQNICSSFDPICFTEKQFEIFQKSNSSLYNEIKKNSSILYGNHSFTH